MPAETEEALNFQGLCHYIGRLSKAAKAGMKAALADTPKCHFAWLEALLHAIRSRGQDGAISVSDLAHEVHQPLPAISRGLFLSPIVKAFALTISLTVHTAPWAAHRRRIVVSVAPAIGAKDAPFARVNRPNCIDQPTFLYLEKRSAGRRRPSGTSERYLCYCTIKFHIMVYYTGTFHI